jgi:hypothetical protein
MKIGISSSDAARPDFIRPLAAHSPGLSWNVRYERWDGRFEPGTAPDATGNAFQSFNLQST